MNETKFPTHSVKGILLHKGQRVQTQKLKFHCPKGENPNAIARQTLTEYVSQIRSREPYTIQEFEIKELPAPKLGAKLNEQHDYVTLRATFLDGVLNMTTSFSGFKMSGDFINNPLTDQLFEKIRSWEKQEEMNVVKVMKDFLKEAQESKTLEEFVQKASAILDKTKK